MTLGRFAVTGGRDYSNRVRIFGALVRYAMLDLDEVLVHGAAPGADTLAADIWDEWFGKPVEPHPADWAKHGKAAGPIRNQEMVDSGIDFLIAFPGGRGTADMVARCRKAGIEVIEVDG